MFYDPQLLSATKLLEDNYVSFREERDALRMTQFMPWPDRSIYDVGWTAFGFYGFGRRLHQNYRLCPRTAAIIDGIPSVRMAGFSRLAPGARIAPHCGRPKSELRYHLGLKVPAGDIGLKVGGEVRRWTEGESLLFDDTREHEAWNRTGSDRIVLLIDVQKPPVLAGR